jgi:hypothetical protein
MTAQSSNYHPTPPATTMAMTTLVLPRRVLVPILDATLLLYATEDAVRAEHWLLPGTPSELLTVPRAFMQCMCDTVTTRAELSALLEHAPSHAALLDFAGPVHLPPRHGKTDAALHAKYATLIWNTQWRGTPPFGLALVVETLYNLRNTTSTREQAEQLDLLKYIIQLLDRMLARNRMRVDDGGVIACFRALFNIQNMEDGILQPIDLYYLATAGAMEFIMTSYTSFCGRVHSKKKPALCSPEACRLYAALWKLCAPPAASCA